MLDRLKTNIEKVLEGIRDWRDEISKDTKELKIAFKNKDLFGVVHKLVAYISTSIRELYRLWTYIIILAVLYKCLEWVGLF